MSVGGCVSRCSRDAVESSLPGECHLEIGAIASNPPRARDADELGAVPTSLLITFLRHGRENYKTCPLSTNNIQTS